MTVGSAIIRVMAVAGCLAIVFPASGAADSIRLFPTPVPILPEHLGVHYKHFNVEFGQLDAAHAARLRVEHRLHRHRHSPVHDAGSAADRAVRMRETDRLIERLGTTLDAREGER